MQIEKFPGGRYITVGLPVGKPLIFVWADDPKLTEYVWLKVPGREGGAHVLVLSPSGQWVQKF